MNRIGDPRYEQPMRAAKCMQLTMKGDKCSATALYQCSECGHAVCKRHTNVVCGCPVSFSQRNDVAISRHGGDSHG